MVVCRIGKTPLHEMLAPTPVPTRFGAAALTPRFGERLLVFVALDGSACLGLGALLPKRATPADFLGKEVFPRPACRMQSPGLHRMPSRTKVSVIAGIVVELIFVKEPLVLPRRLLGLRHARHVAANSSLLAGHEVFRGAVAAVGDDGSNALPGVGFSLSNQCPNP